MFICAGLLIPVPVSAQPGFIPTVTVAPAVKRDVAGGQVFVGTLVPVRISSVGSAVDGRVIEFPVNEGDRVKKGQILARLLTQQLDIQLAGAKAELQLRQHELLELRNGTRPEEKAQAEARYLSHKAGMEYVEAKLRRAKKLFERGTLTEDESQAALMAADQARQSMIEAKAAYELAKTGPRPESISQAEARVLMQQEVVNGLADQIEKHTIRSPYDGYVTQEFTEVGQWQQKGGHIVRVAEMDTMAVEVMVVENYVPSLKLGTKVRIEIPSLPKQMFEGVIAIIVPQADARSRSFPVKMALKNKIQENQPLLKSGMFARVTLPVGETNEATMVPKDAVVLGGPAPVVYVVETDPQKPEQKIVKLQPVELGVADGDLIAVKGGVKPGDKVVVQGNERLRPMSPVRVTGDPGVSAAAK
ncbi:MAG: efflux RND transporter periplasmic adaptor subunit [Planctomycetales bacterium]